MSVQLLIDMNLSPDWVNELSKHGWTSVHWSAVGDPKATDREIMDWARTNGHVVFTHDLDFGTMLALTHAAGPSKRHSSPGPKRITRSHGINRRGGAETARDRFGQRCACRD